MFFLQNALETSSTHCLSLNTGDLFLNAKLNGLIKENFKTELFGLKKTTQSQNLKFFKRPVGHITIFLIFGLKYSGGVAKKRMSKNRVGQAPFQ